MGTSQSNPGAPSNVPIIPPWVPPAPPPLPPPAPPDNAPDDGTGDQPGGDLQTAPTAAPNPIAPTGRFGSARLSLGRFASSGGSGDLRRALGHYTRKGMGGASTAAHRLAGTSRRASALYSALSPTPSADPSARHTPLDRTLLAGKSAQEVINAVVESVTPFDGTQDAESSRDAAKNALSELLQRYPEADLLNLTDEQRALAVELFVGRDIFNRVELDLGRTIYEKAPSAAAASTRMREVLDYVRQTVASTFRRLAREGHRITGSAIATIVHAALRETFAVFEEYVT